MDSKRPGMKTGRSSCGRGAPTPRGMHWETEDSGVRAPRPQPTYPRVFSWPMARREAPRLASIVGESLAALARDVARAERPARARSKEGRCKPIAHAEVRRRGGGPLAPSCAVFLGLGGRRIRGRNMTGTLPDQNLPVTGPGLRVSAPPRDDMLPVAKKLQPRMRRQPRHRSLNTLVPAARGSRRNVSAGTEIRRIPYGKVPAVRLRMWPHLAADDDHPADQGELPLRHRRRQGKELAVRAGNSPGRTISATRDARRIVEE
ncbi:MAG: hypothetical protein RL077_5930 [Verrucomicrobiota bacterium]|jgi:hypothetical protein